MACLWFLGFVPSGMHFFSSHSAEIFIFYFDIVSLSPDVVMTEYAGTDAGHHTDYIVVSGPYRLRGHD